MSKNAIKPVDGTKPEEFLPFEAALERMLIAEGGQLLLEHLKGRHEYELTPGDPPVAMVDSDTQLRAPSPVEGAGAIKLRYIAHRSLMGGCHGQGPAIRLQDDQRATQQVRVGTSPGQVVWCTRDARKETVVPQHCWESEVSLD